MRISLRERFPFSSGRGSFHTAQVSSPSKQRDGIALVGLSVLVAGFFVASVTFVWLLEGGIPAAWWWSPLFLLFPFFWLSPLAIPSLMIIIASSYSAWKIAKIAYPQPKTPLSTTNSPSRVFSRAWKKIRPAALPLMLVALGISFYYLTYTMDYNAVQTIRIGMNVVSRHTSLSPPQANFTIFFYINSPQPATEVTRITGARFSLAVDSQPAGTFPWPSEMWIGGWNGHDIADYLRFDMTGTGAGTVLQHNPNTLIITVQYSAQGYLYQQEVTKTFTILYDNRTSVLFQEPPT